MPIHEEIPEQPVYELACFDNGGEYTHQYGEYFTDKDQAEQVAKLLNGEDRYNQIPFASGWVVQKLETASQNAAYFLAYCATIANGAKYKDNAEGQYHASGPKAQVVKSFLPFDDAYQYDQGIWKNRWEVTLWASTPDELQTRVDEVLTRLNESNNPGELHII
jgi:hypothetical protein